MRAIGPFYTAALYAPLHQELMRVLRKLRSEDWDKPTVCTGWAVRDIAAHLLDVDVRMISALRDRFEAPPPDPPVNSYQDLVAFLNRLNHEWVRAARRMSPGALLDLLAVTGPAVAAVVSDLDMDAPARYPVAWAGERRSATWFDVGRDYTERWHHQQQIREAVGEPGLTDREWLHPALDIFIRVLPHTYRAVPARDGRMLEILIEGQAGGTWVLAGTGNEWRLYEGAAENPTARVLVDQDTAWRLFTRGVKKDEARARVRLEGDANLGAVFLDALAVMA